MRKASIALIAVAVAAIAVAGICLLGSPADDALGIGYTNVEAHLEVGKTRVAISITDLSSTELGVISSYVDAEIEQLMASNDIPSFQAGIVLDGILVWAKGYGDQPDLDTVYMIGSITKTFTATAVLQLYERNLIDLCDDVNDYLPFSVRNPNYPTMPVTIFMLLTHTSGLESFLPCGDSWQQSNELSEWMNSHGGCNITIWPTHPSLEEFLNGSLSTSGPYYSPDAWHSQPGSQWHYSSTGYLLLSYVVERVTDQSPREYVQDNVLSPLGMNNTGYRAASFAGRNAIPHERIDSTDYELPIYDIYDEGAGGLRSTVSDLARYMGAHMNEGTSGGVSILRPETVELMHQWQVDFSGRSYDGFGLGWFISMDGLQGHSGSVYGSMANLRYNKSEQGSYGIIFMLNRGYALGNDMNFVDNFYSVVDQLLWQEANRMFNLPKPTIDQPPAMTYAVNQAGNAMTWHPSSQMPDHYIIWVDGSPPKLYSWNGSLITYNLDGLTAGTHNVTCSVYDARGRSASSTVAVIVQPPSTNEFPIGVEIIGFCGVVVAIVVVGYARLRASKKSEAHANEETKK